MSREPDNTQEHGKEGGRANRQRRIAISPIPSVGAQNGKQGKNLRLPRSVSAILVARKLSDGVHEAAGHGAAAVRRTARCSSAAVWARHEQAARMAHPAFVHAVDRAVSPLLLTLLEGPETGICCSSSSAAVAKPGRAVRAPRPWLRSAVQSAARRTHSGLLIPKYDGMQREDVASWQTRRGTGYLLRHFCAQIAAFTGTVRLLSRERVQRASWRRQCGNRPSAGTANWNARAIEGCTIRGKHGSFRCRPGVH
ncbi:hypothetical protein K466DRAFT_605675 [Polyporus arcularius HHB13444]|uniref:Uncharacterized protein n=1 Tax=Polyporus arcularius HHB13444 TaxID=1314778 RepID=A0A5C3NR48_9APHY|nr:hypothetical protein K466DRAFT_605675 [Polyporus arcularius HHB13444]